MRANIIEAIMGAIVLIIAGFFLVFAYTSSQGSSTNGYTLIAQFDRVDGLMLGSDVRVSGIKVGKVTTLKIDPETYLAKVKMSINSNIKLPLDTVAEIVSESLMGGKYVALVPGGEDKYFEQGQEITNTQSSISFESLLGKYLFSKGDEGGEKPRQKKNASARESPTPSPTPSPAS